ncbi:MAG: hypothetical protein IJE62_02960 [Clostridia bacterium]|nr:hypothetical protein [Clostridia bacterium]
MKKITLLPQITSSGKQLKHPENINIKKKIGTTTYMVNAHFNTEATGDMVSKLKSLMTR